MSQANLFFTIFTLEDDHLSDITIDTFKASNIRHSVINLSKHPELGKDFIKGVPFTQARRLPDEETVISSKLGLIIESSLNEWLKELEK